MHAFAQWQAHGKDLNSLVADPKFKSNLSFTLDPASPAFRLGFVSIDTSSIGPRLALVGAPHSAVAPTGVANDPAIGRLAESGLLR